MLRIAFLVLLLANAGYYAWSAGLLRSVGLAPADPSEPHRIEQQIRPEILRVQPPAASGAAAGSSRAQNPGASTGAPAAAASPVAAAQSAEPAPAPSAAPVAANCLQAGPFDQRQADTLRAALAATGLPADAWSLDGTPVSSRWMVYMGRFADDEALVKKRAELRARNVPYDRPGAALEPGLSLGRFSTEEAAERALATLGNQGVRTARVVQERTGAATDYTLRLPAVTDAMAPRIDRLRPALGSKPLRAC